MPFKSCTYDCIYCQLGPTRHKRAKRHNWVPPETVLAEVKHKLDCRPDYITLSGSGEPTLYSRLDEVIDGLKALTRTPIAVLTNGSLLWRPKVRAALAKADVVIPSLDAGDERQFKAINRPHPAISFDRMIEGMRAFRHGYAGQFWLEVMVLDGLTGLESQLKEIVDHVRRLQPDKVQLNTVVRPPAEQYALPVPPRRLRELAKVFMPQAEVIAAVHRPPTHPKVAASAAALRLLLARRPCTLNDMTFLLGLKRAEALKLLEELKTCGGVSMRRHAGVTYYQAPPLESVPSSRRLGRAGRTRFPSDSVSVPLSTEVSNEAEG